MRPDRSRFWPCAGLLLALAWAGHVTATSQLGQVGLRLPVVDADANATLSEALSGALVADSAATTTRTHALPSAPSAGTTFRAISTGSYGLRLDPGASDAIVLPPGAGGATCPDGEYLEVRPGAAAQLVADNTGNWRALDLSPPFALQTPDPRSALGRLPPMPRQDSTLWAEVGPPTNGTTLTGAGSRWIVTAGTEVGTEANGCGVAGCYYQFTSATSANAQAGAALAGGSAWNDWVDNSPFIRLHVEFPTAVDANGKRFAVGTAVSGVGNFSSAADAFSSAGVALVYASDHSDTDLYWIAVEDGAATNTRTSTHVTDNQGPFWVDFDWCGASMVCCTLYNEAGQILSRETLTTNVPSGSGTPDMVPGTSVRTIVGTTAQVTRLYGAWWCQRADGQ